MTRRARNGAFLLLQETGFRDDSLKFLSINIRSGFSYGKWYLPLNDMFYKVNLTAFLPCLANDASMVAPLQKPPMRAIPKHRQGACR